MAVTTRSRFAQAALIGLAALIVFCTAPAGAAAQTATVTGTVVDAETGLPIEGAHVVLRPADCSGGGGNFLHGLDGRNRWGQGGIHGGGGHHGGGNSQAIRVETGPDGTYVMENVPAGEYMTRAAACGYVPSELIELTVNDGETLVQNFELSSR